MHLIIEHVLALVLNLQTVREVAGGVSIVEAYFNIGNVADILVRLKNTDGYLSSVQLFGCFDEGTYIIISSSVHLTVKVSIKSMKFTLYKVNNQISKRTVINGEAFKGACRT